MTYHYVWLIWSSGFLLPWLALYVADPRFRPVMWRVSLLTAVFGLTEPIWVPEYWNQPSLLELARRTGFDIESFIFMFAIGGIGAVLYDALTKRHFDPVSAAERRGAVASVPRGGPVVAVCLVCDVVFPALEPDLSRHSLHGSRGGLAQASAARI